MNAIAIQAEALSKRYRIGNGSANGGLRDSVRSGATWPLRMAQRLVRGAPKTTRNKEIEDEAGTLWALRNVSFEVRAGERVGIIGVNGAGKSTLLKILSQITEPTSGRALVRGRVSSLLEVGTGFHPELTGRENVYLNGTLLGMSREEIRRQFDAIVDFSGVERFLDMPVKRYSSGMQLRLAFAVAAHLEPEIVLIDEVLAVGDARFQKKCIGKMEEIGQSGRTLLYVSHNLASVSNLCERAIILDAGGVVGDGPAGNAVEEYLSRVSEPSEKPRSHAKWSDPANAPGDDAVRIHGVRILQEGIQGPTQDVENGKEIVVEIEYWVLVEGADIRAGILLHNESFGPIVASGNYRGWPLEEDELAHELSKRGLYRTVCRIPSYVLNDITYRVSVAINEGATITHAHIDGLFEFTVHDNGTMRVEHSHVPWVGCVRPRFHWRTERLGGHLGTERPTVSALE